MPTKQTTKPKIAILSTFHMGQTDDIHTLEHLSSDLLSDKRQKEIKELVDHLVAFKPTKLAVEVEKKEQDKLNQMYLHYLQENEDLGRNEVFQIGFRLAKALKHEEIYCIDWMEKGAARKNIGEVNEWVKENQPKLFREIFGPIEALANADMSHKTMLEIYQEFNKDESIRPHHTAYVNMARIKSEEEYIGMDWLVWWYQRNLIMFSNLADLATSPDERILLIVGGGHVQILENFLRESDLFEVESIESYLRK